MCVGVPMEIVSCDEQVGIVESEGVRREVSLVLLPARARVGDYVLVHAGYAITRLDDEEAAATLALLRGVAGDAFTKRGDGDSP